MTQQSGSSPIFCCFSAPETKDESSGPKASTTIPAQCKLPPKSAWLASGPLQKLTPGGWKERHCVLDDKYCLWISRAPSKAEPGQARCYPLHAPYTDLQLTFKRKNNGLFGQSKRIKITMQNNRWPSIVELRALGSQQITVWYHLLIGNLQSVQKPPSRKPAVAVATQTTSLVLKPVNDADGAPKSKPFPSFKLPPSTDDSDTDDKTGRKSIDYRPKVPPRPVGPKPPPRPQALMLPRYPEAEPLKQDKDTLQESSPLPASPAKAFASGLFRSELQQAIERRQQLKEKKEQEAAAKITKPEETPSSIDTADAGDGRVPLFSRPPPPTGRRGRSRSRGVACNEDTNLPPLRRIVLTRSYSI